jgi:hypothetical protein
MQALAAEMQLHPTVDDEQEDEDDTSSGICQLMYYNQVSRRALAVSLAVFMELHLRQRGGGNGTTLPVPG